MKKENLNQEIYTIVRDYHISTQGDSYQEEKENEKLFEQAKITYGEKAVLDVVKWYNENVIRKAK